MMQIIRSWALGVCAVSLFSCLAMAAVGDGRLKNVIKLITAAALAAVLLSPIRTWQPPDAPGITAAPLPQADMDDLRRSAERMCEQRIERYVSELAEDCGIVCSCRAKCSYSDGRFSLEQCTVVFGNDYDAAVRQTFIAEAAQGIGIDKSFITEGWF